MAEQLASVPEESTTDFSAPSPACYSCGESIWSVAGPEWPNRSTFPSQSGQSGSNGSSISAAGASGSYLFNISVPNSAGAADFGANELYQGRPSIRKVSSSLEKQPASVPEDSPTCFTALSPPSFSYRELIQSVAWPEWSIRSNLPSMSSQSGSSYTSGSSALSSYISNNTGYSSSMGSAGATESRGELAQIARRMVSDGYTQRIVQAFGNGGGQDCDLKNWFVELDADWVLEIGGGYGLWCQFQHLVQDTSLLRQELIKKWVRALTIIVASIKQELVTAAGDETSTVAVARLGKASISAMLLFVDAILDVAKVLKLQLVLHMYICVSSASYELRAMHPISSEVQIIFKEVGTSLEREENTLIQTISSTLLNMRTLISRDNLWPRDESRGGSNVHRKIQMLMECIKYMKRVHASTQNSAQSHNTEHFGRLIDETIGYAKDLILAKSRLFRNPNLGYLFLLNNSYFVAQVPQPSIPSDVGLRSGHQHGLELTPECEQYMDYYLDGSWGDVVSYIRKYRKKTSSVAKFQSAFYTTYHAQKSWKVPDPRLRSLLRECIMKRVISDYCDYLKEYPELEKQVNSGRNRPEIFKQMLGQLFEG